VLKSTFSRYEIPESLVSDNSPQYSSQEFSEFTIKNGFTHFTGSPHIPQSNNHAERTACEESEEAPQQIG